MHHLLTPSRFYKSILKAVWHRSHCTKAQGLIYLLHIPAVFHRFGGGPRVNYSGLSSQQLFQFKLKRVLEDFVGINRGDRIFQSFSRCFDWFLPALRWKRKVSHKICRNYAQKFLNFDSYLKSCCCSSKGLPNSWGTQ